MRTPCPSTDKSRGRGRKSTDRKVSYENFEKAGCEGDSNQWFLLWFGNGPELWVFVAWKSRFGQVMESNRGAGRAGTGNQRGTGRLSDVHPLSGGLELCRPQVECSTPHASGFGCAWLPNRQEIPQKGRYRDWYTIG